MPIYFNNDQITKVNFGEADINKVLAGEKIIYQKTAQKVERILIHDFGGKDYFPNGLTNGEFTTQKHPNHTSYWTMILNPGVVKSFKMPFNATKATLLLECCISRMRGRDSYGNASILFCLSNSYNLDWSQISTIKGRFIYSGDADSSFWKDNNNIWTIYNSNFVEDKVVPTYPDMKYVCKLTNRSDNGAELSNPGYERYEFTDGTQDTYFHIWMYLLSNSYYNANQEGYIKLGKVYLDLTTDPQFQAYWNS